MPSRPRRREQARPWVLAVSVAAWTLSGCQGKGAAPRPLTPGSALYDQGKYAEALPLLAKAFASGVRDGTVLYQLGYCRHVVDGKPEARKSAWKEAEPLLETEVAAPGGATLERLYYLTVITSDEGRFDRMTQHARQAVEQFEKGPDPNALTGDDWFRLGRLHDFLNEPSEAEAAYRRSVSAYSKKPAANAAYHALALARVGDLDYQQARYDTAAGFYEEALKILPGTDQIQPFRHAIALLDSGKFDEAIARFGADRDETTIDESQYGADLARKAKEVAPLADKDRDGTKIAAIPAELLPERVKDAVKDLRAVREKNSVKPGDPLPPEVADSQRRFVTLLRELLVRDKRIQEFCLKERIADLVRR